MGAKTTWTDNPKSFNVLCQVACLRWQCRFSGMVTGAKCCVMLQVFVGIPRSLTRVKWVFVHLEKCSRRYRKQLWFVDWLCWKFVSSVKCRKCPPVSRCTECCTWFSGSFCAFVFTSKCTAWIWGANGYEQAPKTISFKRLWFVELTFVCEVARQIPTHKDHLIKGHREIWPHVLQTILIGNNLLTHVIKKMLLIHIQNQVLLVEYL